MLAKNPIEIIRSVTKAETSQMELVFIDMIKSLYRFELFKDMLDLCMTIANEGRLKFVVQNKEFYALDEGNCLTIDGGVFDTIRGVFKSKKSYTITIKKLASDVVVHEIGHMFEKESGVSLDNEFMSAIGADISSKFSGNISLQSAIKQIMVDEVVGYKKSHHASELFTRFYQVLAVSKDIAGYSSSYGYKVQDFIKAFPNTIAWAERRLRSVIVGKIDMQVAESTKHMVVPIEEIEHKWTDEKIRAIHGKEGNEASKWSRTVKSNKDW